MLFAKLKEEVDELAAELFDDGLIPDVPAVVDGPVIHELPIADPDRQARIQSELGDVLFVIANMARRWHINPEEALRESNRKFERRFQYIERRLREQGRDVQSASLPELESLYQEGKAIEKAEQAASRISGKVK